MPDALFDPADHRSDRPADHPARGSAELGNGHRDHRRDGHRDDHHTQRSGGEESVSTAEGGADQVGLQRLREAVLRPSRAQAVVGILLAALGFAAITQVRTNTTDNTYAGYREQDLVDVLSGLAGTSQRAESELSRLEAERRRLEA